jgi:hypothetical protein
MLGVGLHLYNGDKALRGRKNSPESCNPPDKPNNRPQGGNGGNGDGWITNKQLNYIVNLGRNL